MAINAYISEVTFTAGLSLTLKNESLVVIIGPNNSGKSSTLSSLRDLVADSSRSSSLISSVKLEKISSLDEIREQLAPALDKNGSYMVVNHSFGGGNLEHWWGEGGRGVGGALATLLISNLDTRSRLGDCDPAAPFDGRNAFAANHPFQRMYADTRLEFKTSAAVRRAFKKDLIIYRNGCANIPAYIGDRPEKEPEEESITRSYLDKLEKLDKLEGQGDGIRSWMPRKTSGVEGH